MKTKPSSRYWLSLSGIVVIVAMAAMVSRCDSANQTPLNSADPTLESEMPIEFARRGLSILRSEENPNSDGADDTLKADALIMRAWNLQQAYPESCVSVWQLTQTLVDQQEEPIQKLALTSLYLNSVDAAVESAMTPEGFESLWTVRQAVTADIERHRHDALEAIEREAKEALRSLSNESGMQDFAGADAARWSTLSDELSAMTETVSDPPESLSEVVQSIGKKLVADFDARLTDIGNRLTEEVIASPDQKDKQAVVEIDSNRKPPDSAERGAVTKLLGDLDGLVRMRESASVASWIDQAAKFSTQQRFIKGDEVGDEQLQAAEALRAKMLETRTLRYNMWATDAIYNAERRGLDGLFLLGAIDTRLLVSTVATSYSIAEGKILNEIQNPFDRQVRIREMLGQTKKQLSEF
jgi:hypothetical protein